MDRLIDSTKVNLASAPKNTLMNLKKQLRFLLDHRGMSAARKSSVSKQTLSLWLSGSKPKNVEQIKQVADALGVSVDHLLFGNGRDHTSEQATELDALLGDQWISGLFEIRLRRVKKG